MTSPVPGSTLSGASVTFNWNGGTGVSQYWLYVGTTAGGNEVYGQSTGTNKSVTVNNIPTDGCTIYVRLWSMLSIGWQYNDYSYTPFSVRKDAADKARPYGRTGPSGASDANCVWC
jgi:hypothetical protein